MDKARLIAGIDCTRDYPAQEYFHHGDVRVVDGPAGKYREAEGVPLSRFGYRFTIENIGKPHVAVIRFPDDKQRFMCVVDGTCYDLSTGVVTGFAQPLTGEMLEVRQVFWPRWKDCSLTFMTWGHNEPAAASKIDIYELDSLPALDSPGANPDFPTRELGIQYEDPCGTGCSEGAMSHDEWEERVMAYALHSGQRLFAYPMAWYHGPQYPSDCEPSDAFDVVVAADRKQYVRYTTNPPDWLSPMLERFEEAGMGFQGVLTLLRLGTLMKKMNIDLESIKAGEDTINNMIFTNQVQSGTMDWTPIYNCRNYTPFLEHFNGNMSMDDLRGDFQTVPWAYGEKVDQGFRAGPMFNPIHPVVKEAIVGFVREIGERYGKFPAFKGIAITMWAPTIIWYGSIHSGYDDYSVGLFETETGIKVPVEKTDPERFSKRYEWLTYHCRQAWVDWRCRKIRELICEMRDALVSSRSDMRLTLNLWSEPFVPSVIGSGEPHNQLYARQSTCDLYKDAGVDIDLLRDIPGVELDLQIDGGSRDRGSSSEPNQPIEKFTMFRDHDFLDMKTMDAMQSTRKPGAFIFNAWHEAWGTHRWFDCDPDDEQAQQFAIMSGEKAEGVFRLNSEYPEDGFWWDSQLRITPAFPAGHFMELYAHSVAELDACRITRGGLFLDKAHTEEIRAFSRAYTALPNERFETVGGSTDPVAVRTLVKGTKRYFYAVNREYYPVDVEIAFSATAGPITDLATGQAISAGSTLKLTLGSYELRSFSAGGDVSISQFAATAPRNITDELIATAKHSVEILDKLRSSGRKIPGMDQMQQQISEAIDQNRLAWLRRALTSYIVRKAVEMAGAAQES